MKVLEQEVWPFDEIPEEQPPTALDEAKAEFSNRKNEYRDLVAILNQRNEAT